MLCAYRSAKSIDSCQSAQSAQADMSRNFLLLNNILHVQCSYQLMILLDIIYNGFLWIHNYTGDLLGIMRH